jgi:hypothetical protein
MNRTIYFSAFVFLLLLALLFLLSHQLSRFSAPRSMLQSGKAIDLLGIIRSPAGRSELKDGSISVSPLETKIREFSCEQIMCADAADEKNLIPYLAHPDISIRYSA